jgi:hypothetical protein
MSNDTTTLKLGTAELAVAKRIAAAVETIAGREPAPPIDDALLERLVGAIERIADALVPTDEPALAPAGLILLPRGAKVDYSMASEIPVGMEGIQTFRPANYDGPISAEVTGGNGTVTPEGDSGDVFRVSPADGAAEGDTITVKYSADERHGSGVKESDDEVTYTVVAADAEPLTEAGFDVVAKGEPVPAA